MFVVYLVVIGFGLNAFRQTPVGFIPQVDGGYLIVVVQLPPGASLSRTDAVQQRALDIALDVPGVAHGVNVIGFSGATFTNAPNSGAIFLTLKPFEERAKDPRQSAAGIQAELNNRLSKDSGRLFDRRAAAAGARHQQCRRLPHDHRGSRRPRSRPRCGRSTADFMARATQTSGDHAGLHAVRDVDAASLSRHRPHQGAAPRRQRAGRVQRAAGLYRLGLCQRLQSVRPHLPRHRAGA